MRLFDVQGIEILAPPSRVYQFVRDPANLPLWAHAFRAVRDGHVVLQTPAGAVDVQLDVLAHEHCGTVDWRMQFPDGSVAVAQSRVTDTLRSTSIYCFVLHAPPLALEEVEGALEAQRITLQSELATLKTLLER
jgi:hypothetical protein